MVGTAVNTVAFSRDISASASSASKRGSRMMEAPARKAMFITAVWPKVWNRGSPPKTMSSARRSNASMSVQCTCSTIDRCEPTAPFGVPVVPEV